MYGNVGIGTTAPGNLLDVHGPAQIGIDNWDTQVSSPQLVLRLLSNGISAVAPWSSFDIKTVAGNYTTNKLEINSWDYAYGQSGALFTLQGDGNVGIGTTSPSSLLTINAPANSNANALTIYSGDTVAGDYTSIGSIYANGNTNVNSQIRFGNVYTTGGSSYLAFATGTGTTANEQMRIDQNGSVGIGTTAPAAQLHVIAPANASGRDDMLTLGNTNNNTLTISAFGQTSPTTPATIQLAAWNAEQNISIITDALANTQAGGSTKGIFIKSGGNVGIGNTSPTTLLQIGNGGAGKLTVYSQDSGYGQFEIGNPASGGEASMAFISGVTGWGASSANGSSYVWDIGANNYGIGGNKFGIGNQAYGGVILAVQSNGNVGIGTTAPNASLNVVGSTILVNPTGGNYNENLRLPAASDGYSSITMGTLTTTTLGLDANSWSILREPSSFNYNFAIRNASSTDVFDITSAGNVGIGMTSPGYALDVNGDIHATTNLGVILNAADRPLITRGWDAFTSGNWPGIGRWGLFMEPCTLTIGTPNAAGNGMVQFVRFNVDGSYSTTASIDSSGNVWAYGTITAAGNSDRRLKQNIKPLTDTLSKLDQLRGVSFEWNHLATSMGHKEGQKAIGMIAQEVQKVYPELVIVAPEHDGRRYLSIDYEKFTAVLLQAIKELDGKVISLFKGLSDRVQALEVRMDKVNGLEKEIHALKEEIRGFKAVNKEIKERVEKLENAKRSK
jgi:hypothetical protein